MEIAIILNIIIACTILPYPYGEILNTKCYSVKDKWQCIKRMDVITASIRKNFDFFILKNTIVKKYKVCPNPI